MGQRIERVSDLREFSQKLTGYTGTALIFTKSFIIDFERLKNKLERLEQLEQENKELKEAKKSMREKLHNAHRAWVKWERKAIQAKQVFEQKKTECNQLTKVLGEKNRKIKELEQANIRRAEDEFEALSWEE